MLRNFVTVKGRPRPGFSHIYRGMKRVFLLLCAVALVACVGMTEPDRDNLHCRYPGDTIAYQVVSLGGVAIHCEWTVATKEACFTNIIQKYGQKDCKEGEKWPRV